MQTKSLVAEASAQQKDGSVVAHQTEDPNLPTYTRKQVSGHDAKEKGIWVIYGVGVYDITEFVDAHPGELIQRE